MALRYQDVYPSPALLASGSPARPSAAELLTVEYFEADPAAMPAAVYVQHHVLLNLKRQPMRVENIRDHVHRDFEFHCNDIVVTPAGVRSGWRWHDRSKVIVITLDPTKLDRFASTELGVALTGAQLKSLPQFQDADICQAGVHLLEALQSEFGSAVLFDSLARVFLVKLIGRYGERPEAAAGRGPRLTAAQYRRVLDHVRTYFDRSIALDELAGQAGISPYHFSRLFKRTMGRSPMQFVTGFRVERAREMLADPSLPLTTIAVRCGFADQAHFSRQFKQLTGETPGRYRRRLDVRGSAV